jgi:citrate lyase synthetase
MTTFASLSVSIIFFTNQNQVNQAGRLVSWSTLKSLKSSQARQGVGLTLKLVAALLLSSSTTTILHFHT